MQVNKRLVDLGVEESKVPKTTANIVAYVEKKLMGSNDFIVVEHTLESPQSDDMREVEG